MNGKSVYIEVDNGRIRLYNKIGDMRVLFHDSNALKTDCSFDVIKTYMANSVEYDKKDTIYKYVLKTEYNSVPYIILEYKKDKYYKIYHETSSICFVANTHGKTPVLEFNANEIDFNSLVNNILNIGYVIDIFDEEIKTKILSSIS